MAEADQQFFGGVLRLLPSKRWAHGPATLRTLYNRAADSWHEVMLRLGYLDAYRELVAAADVEPCDGHSGSGLAVLDVGCGSGGFALAMASQLPGEPRVDLLDVSECMLAKARIQLEESGFMARTIPGELSELADQRSSYDVVAAAHVIEHFTDPAVELARMARLLKPEGILLLVVSKPHWCNTLVWLRWRHKVFAERQVTDALERAGFAQIQVHRFASGPPSRTSLGFIARLNRRSACS